MNETKAVSIVTDVGMAGVAHQPHAESATVERLQNGWKVSATFKRDEVQDIYDRHIGLEWVYLKKADAIEKLAEVLIGDPQ